MTPLRRSISFSPAAGRIGLSDGARSLGAAVFSLAFLLMGVVASPAQAGAFFVYRGAGCEGRKALAASEAFFDRRIDGVVDFGEYRGDWKRAVSEARWAAACWKGLGRELAFSVPLAVHDGPAANLADVAAGRADAAFEAIARALIEAGFDDAYVRLGWEFNGSWYRWGAKEPKIYAQAFRRAHDAMAKAHGAHFRFVWNPTLYTQGYAVAQAYPGDAYADVIASDVYNQSWWWGTVWRNRAIQPFLWWAVSRAPWGVSDVVAFAAQHHKPYAFPEWGTGERPDGHGGGDDAVFIRRMAPLVKAAEFAGYWDYDAGDYKAQVSNGAHRRAGAALKARVAGSR